jgi:P-type conjugative transfer protein TrbL
MNPTFFSSVSTPFLTQFPKFIGPILTLATPVFWLIASLELCCVMAVMLTNRDIPSMLDDLFYSLMGIGLGYVIFQNAALWGEDLWATFGFLGGQISGISTVGFSADNIMQLGSQIFETICGAVGLGTWLNMPITTIGILISGVVIFLVFLWISVVVMLLQIEAFAAFIGGSIFLPFGAFRFTKHMIAAWVSWILGAGVQLFFTYLVLAIALPIVQTWVASLGNIVVTVGPGGLAAPASITSNVMAPGTMLAQTLVFWVLAVFLPKQARRKVDNAVSPEAGMGSFMGVVRAGFAADSGGAALVSNAVANTGAVGGAVNDTADNLRRMLLTT